MARRFAEVFYHLTFFLIGVFVTLAVLPFLASLPAQPELRWLTFHFGPVAAILGGFVAVGVARFIPAHVIPESHLSRFQLALCFWLLVFTCWMHWQGGTYEYAGQDTKFRLRSRNTDGTYSNTKSKMAPRLDDVKLYSNDLYENGYRKKHFIELLFRNDSWTHEWNLVLDPSAAYPTSDGYRVRLVFYSSFRMTKTVLLNMKATDAPYVYKENTAWEKVSISIESPPGTTTTGDILRCSAEAIPMSPPAWIASVSRLSSAVLFVLIGVLFLSVMWWNVFRFSLLQEIPYPTWAVLCAMPILYVIVWHGWKPNEHLFLYQGSLADYIEQQRNPQTHKEDEVLIIGSSATGWGASADILNQRFGGKVAKISASCSFLWEANRILRKCKQLTPSLKTAIIEIQFRYLARISKTRAKKSYFLALREWYDLTPQADLDLTVCERFLPTKSPLRRYMSSRRLQVGRIHEAGWERIDEENPYHVDRIDGAPFVLDKSFEIAPQARNKIESIYNYCSDRNMTLVLNFFPKRVPILIDAKPEELEGNATCIEFRQSWIDRAKTKDNLVVLNDSSFDKVREGIPPKLMFWDRTHMRQKGAALYTTWICDQLLADKNLCQTLNIPWQKDRKTDYKELIADLKSSATTVSDSNPEAPVKVASQEAAGEDPQLK